jgi:hypothetical protein
MDIFDREQIERLSVTAIYKWVFLGAFVICIPYQLVMGLLALIGLQTVSWNGQPVTGFWGLLLGPSLGFLAVVILTGCLGTACVAARWLFSRIGSLEAGVDDDQGTEHPP